MKPKTYKRNKSKRTDWNNYPPNKGKLQADASVADQYITFPTDAKLINSSRKELDQMIDKLYHYHDKKIVNQKLTDTYWIKHFRITPKRKTNQNLLTGKWRENCRKCEKKRLICKVIIAKFKCFRNGKRILINKKRFGTFRSDIKGLFTTTANVWRQNKYLP